MAQQLQQLREGILHVHAGEPAGTQRVQAARYGARQAAVKEGAGGL